MFSRLKQTLRKSLWKRWLPCYIFSRKPLILAAYDTDFIRNADQFLPCFAAEPDVYLFLQLGWQHETPKVVDPFAARLREILAKAPNLHLTILANSPKEVEVLSGLGFHTVLCHQNAFLDESRYRIATGTDREFDAVYIARITPFKRHLLSVGIPCLYLIGDFYVYTPQEGEYIEDVRKKLKHAVWERIVSAKKIDRAISRAHCGLCLSAEEGAMFVSAEYLLCGIPVVNTPNIGGRDELFPPFAVKTVEPDAEAVAEAVREFCASAPSPEAIRKAVLEKMEPHRRLFRSMLNEILSRAHEQNPSIPAEFTGKLPHKLGLRTARMPWVNWKHGLARGKQR